MDQFIKENLVRIPNLNKEPLQYICEEIGLDKNSLLLEFGVYNGKSINYISNFTTNTVYGFDCFNGLPEDWRPGHPKGEFDLSGNLPIVNNNVVLIKGYFQETLETFLKITKKKISFIHIDSDLYSSAIYILNTVKPFLEDSCIVVFDELVNFEYFEGTTSELYAFYEFLSNNKDVKYEWIGMNGEVDLTYTKNVPGYYFYMGHSVAVRLFK